MDPIIGANQKRNAFWKRIRAHYNDECDGPDATQGDMMSMARPMETKRAKVAQANKKKLETIQKALEKLMLDQEKAMKESRAKFDKINQEFGHLRVIAINTYKIANPVYRLHDQKRQKEIIDRFNASLAAEEKQKKAAIVTKDSD
ncbi:hypothetical protein EDC94DRAFT_653161 [Helicostylum pulchrum]|nr:hypothetical protein EDC94DRAFT_653161 [Helicostylum pulchrum]